MVNGVTSLLNRAKFLVNENSATILTSLGVTGTIATAYLTGRATFKAAEIIRREESIIDLDSSDLPPEVKTDMTTKQKIKAVWTLYIPPTVVGITTITAIIAANRIASKKIAALAMASSISERALKEYKDKVMEKFGASKEQDVRDGVAQDRINRNPPQSNEVIITGTGEVLCYDMYMGRYFLSTAEKIRQAENKVNYELVNHMYASATEFYDAVGLPATSFTDKAGWNANEPCKLVFSSAITPDERPCLAFDFINPPFLEYDRLHE